MRLDYKQLKPYRDYQRDRMLGFRLTATRVAIVAAFTTFAGVFWYLQIAEGQDFRLQAEQNRLRRRVERPIRGVIRDVDGKILVSNRPSFTVYLDRERAEDPRAATEAFAELAGEEAEPLFERVERGSSVPIYVPVPLKGDVGLGVAARIAAHRNELASIDVDVDARRFYPLGSAAAHVVGYLSEASPAELRSREGLIPGDRVGRFGIEESFDVDLRGRHGLLLQEVNARGRPIRTVTEVRPAQHGRPMQLTIDGRLQKELEDAFEGRSGAAVFLDPTSGAVRALYSAPSFDPNLFSGIVSSEDWSRLTEDRKRPLQNRAIAGTYSPGSTFKVVVALAALAKGVLQKGETVYCSGSTVLHGQRRHCHFRGGHGWVDLEEAIERSCNVFFYEIGDRLDLEPIADWARRFGLGTPTGLPLTGEASGLVPSREWKRKSRNEMWYPGETISVAIGQGPILVTPAQLAVVAAAVANGGSLVAPFLRERAAEAPEPTKIDVPKRHLDKIRRGMVRAVEGERGTARRARIEGYQVAGKTGTSQVVALGAQRDPGDHSWFIGFAPADDPVLAWAVIVENAGHGGSAAAPIAARVARAHLERVPDDRSQLVASAVAGDGR